MAAATSGATTSSGGILGLSSNATMQGLVASAQGFAGSLVGEQAQSKATVAAASAQEWAVNRIKEFDFNDAKVKALWATTRAIDHGSEMWQQAKAVAARKIKDEYGEEIFDLLETLQHCLDKLQRELRLSASKFGLMLALPLVHLQHDSVSTPETKEQMQQLPFLVEANYWIDFASAAYGQVVDNMRGHDKELVDKAMIIKALESRAKVELANLPVRSVLCPGHVVAVDVRKQCIVLAIRGTTSESDAITDAVGECVDVPEVKGVKAHKGVLDSARKVLEKVRPVLQEQLAKHKGWKIVVTGHSLGAACAVVCTLLLSATPLKGKPKLSCWAYAPPPVFYPKTPSALSSLEIYCFVNRNDVVPRASLRNVFLLGLEAMAVDSLDLGLMDRLNLIYHGKTPSAEESHKSKVMKVIQDAVEQCRLKPHNEFLPLYIPGKVYWLEWPVSQITSGIDNEKPPEERGASDPILPQKMWLVDSQQFQRILVPSTTASLNDHLCSQYKTALATIQHEREKELAKQKKCCAVM